MDVTAPDVTAPDGERLFDRASLTDDVVEAVRRMARSGRLVPGELYSVQQLADQLGVSRSPVREGLLKLAEAGLVSFQRNRGFRVTLPDGRDIAEIFAVRLALEPRAAARAAAVGPDGTVAAELNATLVAMRAAATAGDEQAYWVHDRHLHEVVLDAAGNRRATRIVDEMRRTTWLLGSVTTGSRTLADVAADHESLVAAIADGDASAAQRAMHDHLTRTGRLLMAQSLADPANRADPAQVEAEVDRIWAEVAG